MEALATAAGEVLVVEALLVIALGAVFGIVLGAIPGLTATMGVTLMLPISLYLPTALGLSLLLAVYVGAVAGASVPAILLGIPGNPNAIATVRDGHAMTRRGLAGQALGAAAVASLMGGLFSLAVLVLVAPLLAPVTLAFGPAEKTMLAVLGLAAVAAISSDDLLKGIFSATLGIALAVIGLDLFTSRPRLPFGELMLGTPLQTGLPLVPALIGLFGISQALVDLERLRQGRLTVPQTGGGPLLPSRAKLRSMTRLTTESAGIGTFIGALPGAGASIAVFLAYERARSLTTRRDTDLEPIGSGRVEGVVAPEVANNAVTGGGLLPVLTLGLPGDAVGAILLGALLIQGIVPGHTLFASDLALVYGIFLGMAVAILFVFLFQMAGMRLFPMVLAVPLDLLGPVVFLACLVGAFAVNGQSIVAGSYNIAVALGFGALGYLLRLARYPIAPLVLGLVLGGLLEENLRLAVRQAGGSYTVFLTEPISLAIAVVALVWMAGPFIARRLRRDVAGAEVRR